MGKKEIEIMNPLKNFMEKVRKIINVERFILFGSRATGKAKENSDIDLIIVSRDFEDIKFYKRSPKLYLLWDAPYDIDIICLTPEELNKKKKEIGIMRDAMKQGVEL